MAALDKNRRKFILNIIKSNKWWILLMIILLIIENILEILDVTGLIYTFVYFGGYIVLGILFFNVFENVVHNKLLLKIGILLYELFCFITYFIYK